MWISAFSSRCRLASCSIDDSTGLRAVWWVLLREALGAPIYALLIAGLVAGLAFRRREGQGPGLVWLGGFKSDMAGTKAQALADWALANGRSYLRFDYFGHGEASGLGHRAQDQVDIQRYQGARVDHLDLDAFLRECFAGLQRLVHHERERDEPCLGQLR